MSKHDPSFAPAGSESTTDPTPTEKLVLYRFECFSFDKGWKGSCMEEMRHPHVSLTNRRQVSLDVREIRHIEFLASSGETWLGFLQSGESLENILVLTLSNGRRVCILDRPLKNPPFDRETSFLREVMRRNGIEEVDGWQLESREWQAYHRRKDEEGKR